MITAVVIDDEFNSRDYLKNLFDLYFKTQIHIYGMASNIQEGAEMINVFHPEIVFLDIEMPDGNGFKLLQSYYQDVPFEVVFTTAHKEYALEAIKNNAFDYLLKPIDKNDVVSLIKKIEKKFLDRKQNGHTILVSQTEELNKIALSTLYGIKFIEPFTFLYAQAEGSYTNVYSIDGQKVTISKSLKEFEAQTNQYNFFRVHKSFIINLQHVSEFIKKDEYYVVMKTNVRIPISIRRKDEFLAKLA